jgi:hypothetical protein
VLKTSKFYIQRPPTYNPPFLVVKVVRVIYDDPPTNKIQWGAWCQHWEISTKGDDMDYYADPYHANSKHQDGQAYKENKSGQPSWSYESHALSTFQDEVTMNKNFDKKPYKHAAAHNHTQPCHIAVPLYSTRHPLTHHQTTSPGPFRGWNKQLRTAWGVQKRTINYKDHAKIRNFVFRWSPAGERAAQDEL